MGYFPESSHLRPQVLLSGTENLQDHRRRLAHRVGNHYTTSSIFCPTLFLWGLLRMPPLVAQDHGGCNSPLLFASETFVCFNVVQERVGVASDSAFSSEVSAVSHVTCPCSQVLPLPGKDQHPSFPQVTRRAELNDAAAAIRCAFLQAVSPWGEGWTGRLQGGRHGAAPDCFYGLVIIHSFTNS